MQMQNEFTVGVPVETAWAVLTDLEGIAPCMPGAKLTGREGDDYMGTVKLKVGPITANYAGVATFAEKDDAAHRAVIDARGKDARSGNANALITATLHDEGGDRTRVAIDTDLQVSGKLAQFGTGMMAEISNKLLAQFTACLEAKLDAGDLGAAGAGSTAAADVTGAAGDVAPQAAEGAATAPTPTTPATPAPEPAAPAPQPAAAGAAAPPASASPSATGLRSSAGDDEPEALDLMALAGGSIAKRVVPLVVGVVVVVVLLYLLLG